MDWVINPYTGRKIKINGPTYNRLKKEGENVDSFSPVENKENNNYKRNRSGDNELPKSIPTNFNDEMEMEMEMEKYRQWKTRKNNFQYENSLESEVYGPDFYKYIRNSPKYLKQAAGKGSEYLGKAELAAGKSAGYLQRGAGYLQRGADALQSGAGYLQSGSGYLQSGAEIAGKGKGYLSKYSSS